ncbi:hypothetical protein AAG570_004987 [Ranatra chinensis]|uniref:Uncharacterized protein n=1 Tax=Ranatra chinensis TaxID=642074 RepID=A0ABD0Y1M6_9HEMI
MERHCQSRCSRFTLDINSLKPRDYLKWGYCTRRGEGMIGLSLINVVIKLESVQRTSRRFFFTGVVQPLLAVDSDSGGTWITSTPSNSSTCRYIREFRVASRCSKVSDHESGVVKKVKCIEEWTPPRPPPQTPLARCVPPRPQ